MRKVPLLLIVHLLILYFRGGQWGGRMREGACPQLGRTPLLAGLGLGARPGV
jgi:hypothetical protein